jgi:hypothetical protein
MTLSKPIPKALLPHTVILKTSKALKMHPVDSVCFDEEFDEIILYNVRVENNEKVRQTKSGDNRTSGARMYFDCENSVPKNIDFNTEQLIVFCGVTYKIEAIKSVMAANKIHHYRIEII